jgi:signal transduction histidine kinase
LSSVRPAPTKSYSVRRVNQLLGGVYSFVLVAITVEALVNGQSQLQYLNHLVFYFSAAVLLVLVIGFLVSHWFYRSEWLWPKLIAINALVLLGTWPLHFDSSVPVPESFKPWIWWLLGVAAIAAGASFLFLLGVGYILTVSVAWFVLRTSASGGAGESILALQDSLHLLILSSIGTAMILVLRWQAQKVDFANEKSIAAGVRSAQREALDLERSRLDALVHDSVLTTLLIAAKAKTPEQIESARSSANQALKKLDAARESTSNSETVTLVSFFEALEQRIKDLSGDFHISIEKVNDLPLSASVSEALTEATLQAVDNSIKHSGNAIKKKVLLQGRGIGLKIVVSDNGRGFRPAKIPKSRAGIKISIMDRVKNVGGRVHINSAPGKGTGVVIEWGPND